MRTHELKTWPEPFAAVLAGSKRYEVRVDDRGFMVGDVLVLQEYDPRPFTRTLQHPVVGYTDRSIRVVVTYKTPGGSWGLPANLCVLGFKLVEEAERA